MDDVRVGSVLRAVRIRRGLRQRDVADSAGVSQALVSSIERGELDRTSLHLLRRVAGAAGVSLSLAPRWRGADLAKLLDQRHAWVVRSVVARLGELGWSALPEQTFSVHGEHGSIDVFAWSEVSRAVLVIEVKTVLVDLQDLLSTMDRKRRLAPALARELGWRPLLVGSLLVMPDETQARNAVERYAPIFQAACPSRGAQVRLWLKRPERDMRGIWFLNINPGGATGRPGGSMRVRPKRPKRIERVARSSELAPRSSEHVARSSEPISRSVGADAPFASDDAFA
jgi:transcriptional regulator with XRE-family HTH domain